IRQRTIYGLSNAEDQRPTPMKPQSGTAKVDELLVLAVETAGRGGSVALVRGQRVVALAAGDPGISHSNTLLSDIQQCLDSSGVSLKEIDLFAAASGPGSFTGLRIGIATVKGLAATLVKPVVGTPTLHALAHSGGKSPATVALLPAGRGEVFVQLLSVSSEGAVAELDQPAHLLPQRVMDKYASFANLKWVGPGAQLYRALIQQTAGTLQIQFRETDHSGMPDKQPGWTLIIEPAHLARNVAALALAQFQDGDEGGPQALSAIYVRPSDAELTGK
ncbi:MAG: tRNA (adenosine(37)-N6)-threonylcarbamoyltransferase complex dimerization subunit type 1 TsaB, partial [Acidobacteriota bacterium]